MPILVRTGTRATWKSSAEMHNMLHFVLAMKSALIPQAPAHLSKIENKKTFIFFLQLCFWMLAARFHASWSKPAEGISLQYHTLLENRFSALNLKCLDKQLRAAEGIKESCSTPFITNYMAVSKYVTANDLKLDQHTFSRVAYSNRFNKALSYL